MAEGRSFYFRGTAATSSSFKVNFFRRASEISVAESSSLSDVQPLLYLRGHKDISYPPVTIGWHFGWMM